MISGSVCLVAVFSGGLSVAAPERLATAAFAIAKDPSGVASAAAVGAVLRQKIADHPRLVLIDPARELANDPRTREEDLLARARAALSDGRKSWDALKLDDAIARLGQSVVLYQQTGPMLGDLSEFLTSLMFLGAALTLRGSTEEAMNTFSELLALSPGYVPEGLPSSVVKVFNRAAAKTSARPKGSIEIYSTPPYAAAHVDGRFLGVTPLVLENLSEGTHYLRLEQNGYVTYGAPIEIVANQRITNQSQMVSTKRGAELRDFLSRASREVLGDGMASNLRSLARLLVADALIVITVSQSGKDVAVTGGLFDATNGTRILTERAALSADLPSLMRDVAPMIERLLLTAEGQRTTVTLGQNQVDAAAAAGAPAIGSATQGGDASGTGASGDGAGSATVEHGGLHWTKWAAMGGGGAGVIALGVGVGVSIWAHNTYSAYRDTSQASPDLRSIRDTGKTRALVADVCVFGGAALAIGGGLLYLFGEPKSALPEELLDTSPVRPNAIAFVPSEGGGSLFVGGTF